MHNDDQIIGNINKCAESGNSKDYSGSSIINKDQVSCDCKIDEIMLPSMGGPKLSLNKLEKRVNDIIIEQSLIKNKNVILGLSGGPDSVCLLNILCVLAEFHKFNIFPVHINHMLRGDESEEDEKYCKNICEELKLKLNVFRFDVNEISIKNKQSIEEAARDLRYSAFRQISKEVGGALIAVAHNKNDQAETVLMRIIRGTGIEGLRGMEYRNGDIIRPLLSTTRVEIEEYCMEKGVVPRIDSTNLKNIYHRNKIRLDLIPYIEGEFNSNFTDALFRLSQNAKTDFEYLDMRASEDFEVCLQYKKDREIGLRLENLKAISNGAMNRVVKNAIKDVVGSSKGIEAVHINDVCSLIKEGRTGAVLQLPKGIRVRKSYDSLKIYIEDLNKQSTNNECLLLLEGTTNITNDEYFTVEIIDSQNIGKPKENEHLQYFDYDALRDNPVVRCRKQGDFIYPFKSKGKKKLKEFFIDQKVEVDKRENVRLLACGNEIIWIVGLRTSDNFKVTENTNRVLKVLYYKKN